MVVVFHAGSQDSLGTGIHLITNNQDVPACNCIVKNQCPLNGECLAENTIYEATISIDDDTNDDNVPMKYIGLAETTFKKRFSNHKKSFNHERYENETELSKQYWKFKRQNKNPTVSWKIVRRTGGFQRASMKCNLCLNEKLEIATKFGDIMNSKSELISKCRHVNKHTLALFDSKD